MQYKKYQDNVFNKDILLNTRTANRYTNYVKIKNCYINTNICKDPRLIDKHRLQLFGLDKPPLGATPSPDKKISFDNDTYGEIAQGNDYYYYNPHTDRSPYYEPLYHSNYKTRITEHIDPVGNKRIEYDIRHNPCWEAESVHSPNLSYIYDTNKQREVLMSINSLNKNQKIFFYK